MHWYKSSRRAGRFIGNSNNLTVYEDSFEPVLVFPEKGRKDLLPGEVNFNYGPSTGGLLESVRFSFSTPGEYIKAISIDKDFKKRFIQISGKNVEDSLLLVERINGFHSASFQVAFLKAVEDAGELENNSAIDTYRILQIELERIRSNISVIERMCEPAGFGVPYNQLNALKEESARIISKIFQHRYFFSVNSLSEISAEPSGEVINRLLKLKNNFRDIFESLQYSKIFVNRLQGNGTVLKHWLVGPAARAAGRKHDARFDSKSLDYGKYSIDMHIENDGDAFSRFLVRGYDALVSFDIVDAILRGGIEKSSVPNYTSISGEGAARVESPQGDLFFYVRMDDGIIKQVEFVSPSISNILAFEISTPGNIFTDFHFNWESFGIWVSEAGVEIK